MISRRGTIVGAVALAMLAAHGVCRSQAGAAKRRVGWLSSLSPASGVSIEAAFKQGMRTLGWQEGKDVEYLIKHANGDFSGLDALASELTAQQIDVIVVGTTQAALAAHTAAPNVPIVMASGTNPERVGLGASLARPGGSVTGLSIQVEELHGKQIELLHEMVPNVRRIAVLLSANSSITDLTWKETRRACAAFGLQPQRFAANDPAQIAEVVERIVRERSQAVAVPSDGMFYGERERLPALLQAAGLPAVYAYRESVQAGGLFSYGVNIPATWRYAATFVDKILKGAKPGELPVEQWATFELVVNMRAAKALGIAVPRALLLRADEVIE